MYRPAPGIAAPRIERVLDDELGVEVVPRELHELRRAPEAILRPRIATWLDRPEAQPSQQYQLDGSDIGQIKALAAAALADIAGLRRAAVCEWITPPKSEHIDGSRRRELLEGAEPELMTDAEAKFTARKLREGRGLWVKLAAWPWWPLANAGFQVEHGLRSGWWRLEPVTQAFQDWMTLTVE